MMLQAFNANTVVDELEQTFAQDVDALRFAADDEVDDEQEGSHDQGNNA